MSTESLLNAKTEPLWWENLETSLGSRPALSHDIEVDVAVVGAGYTGLWTAFYLKQADPDLRIAVVERSHVGFGASGRNGGFCYDGFAAGTERIEAMSDLDTAREWAAALRETVGVVADVADRHGIDCDLHKGGTIEFLANGGQMERAGDDVEVGRRFGWTAQQLRLLSRDEALEVARAARVVGGLWSSETAAIHPAKLAHGLARVVEGLGVAIYENTAVQQISKGVLQTAGGTVTAPFIVRATEGYTAEIAGHKRDLAPLYSLMIATEPLSDAMWDEIGLSNRETFGELRHLVIYGQRTADGRIAFGGRGAPYDYASRVRVNADFDHATFAPVHRALLEVFPQLTNTAITHRWGGVLGVSRQWMPTAGIDRASGTVWAGGYVGSGVAATNLAGRTLADLVTGADTRLTRFPWVNHRVRKWEPEPLRWLGINAALRVMKRADAVEAKTDKAAKSAEWLWRVVKI